MSQVKRQKVTELTSGSRTVTLYHGFDGQEGSLELDECTSSTSIGLSPDLARTIAGMLTEYADEKERNNGRH